MRRWGISDFMIRAFLVPHMDPRLASIELVGMPTTLEQFKKLLRGLICQFLPKNRVFPKHFRSFRSDIFISMKSLN